jgi:hypothetical protein
MKYTFSATDIVVGEEIELSTVSEDALECIPNLAYCPLGKAMQLGGRLIRAVLESAPIVGDQKDIYVELVGGLLMPGWYPTRPGWHLDDLPVVAGTRGGYAHYSLEEQARRSREGIMRRLHTMVIGIECPTVFLNGPVTLDLEHAEDMDLNPEIDRLVEEGDYPHSSYPNNRWTSWDWWTIHRTSPAAQRGWRLLVRVIESDLSPHSTDFVRDRVIFIPSDFRRK